MATPRSLLGYRQPTLLGYGQPGPSWTDEEVNAAAIQRAAEDRGSNAFTQAWQATGAGFNAGDLRELALEAQQAGDAQRANELLRRADVETAKAGVLGNDVSSIGDLKLDQPGALRRAANWLGGAAGSMARSAAPATGAALAGGAVGGLMAGPGGAAAGAARGAGTTLLRALAPAMAPAAAGAVSFDQLRGEAVSNQFADPDVMKRSADERAMAATLTAGAQALTEAILPTRAAGAVLERAVASQGAKRVVNTVADTAFEGGGETLQAEIGYQGQQALGSQAERDPMAYWDALAAGAAGGGTFSGAANLAGAALDKAIPAMRLGDFKGRPKAEDLANPNLTLEERVKGFFDERMTRKLARYLTPDAVLADELRGVSPEVMAEAIQKRDAEMAVESEADADNLLAQEGYLSESERQIVAGLKGKFNDPVNRAELGVIMGKRKIIEVAETLGQAAADAAKRLLGKVGAKFSMEGMDVAPLVDALAPIYENKAPAAAQSWIKLAASLEGIKTFDAIQDPDLAGRLEEMSEMLPLIDRKGSVRKAFEAVGLTNMFTLMDELQDVPGAVGDVRKQDSFLRTMLKNRTDPRVQERAVAERVDQLASKFPNMSPEAQAAALDSFSMAFGTPENAKAVLEYYAPMRQQALDKFKAVTDKVPLPDQSTRGIEPPGNVAEQVFDNGLTQPDYDNLEASYRDANPARPFYAPFDDKKLEAEVAKAGTYEDGTPKVRTATMAEYIKRTGASAAEAFGQIRTDLERRLNATRKRDKGWLTKKMEAELPGLEAQLQTAVAEGADLRTRQTLERQITKLKDQAAKAKDRSDLPRLEAEFATLQKLTPSQEDLSPNRFDKALSRYKVAMREGADTRATDEDIKRFQRLVRVKENLKPPAPISPNASREERDAHMARVIQFEEKSKAIAETEVTFTKTDGTQLVVSAESMTYASPTKGGDLQKFLSAVASMLERDDIADVKLPSSLVVFREGKKRKRRTLAGMRDISKVRKTLMERAKTGNPKQKAFAQRALALIDASAEGAINRQVAGEARAKRRAEPTNKEEAADRDKIAAREAKREARRKKRAERDKVKYNEWREKLSKGYDRVNAAWKSTPGMHVVELIGHGASKRLMTTLPKLRAAEAKAKESKKAEDWDTVEDLRSEERVLSELVREWLDTELPLPKREEYTQNLADELVDEGYDETDLQAAYLDDLIGVLEQRLALVRPQMTKEQVRELYELNRELQLAVDREDAKASAGLTEAIAYIVAEFDTQNDSKLVKSLKRDIEAAEDELNELMDSAGRNPRDGSRRVQENPTRYFQSAETIQELHQDLAQGVMGAELDRSQIPLIELAFQGEVDKLRAEMKDRKLSTPMHQEMIRAYQLALGKLRRIKAEQEHATRVRARIAGLTKRFKDAKERPVRTHLAAQIRDLRKELAARAISHKDGVPLPLDPATSYGRVEPESKATPDPVGGGASRATKREGVEVLGLTPERNNERMANEIAFWKRNAEVKQLLAKKMKAPEDQARKDPRTVGEIETHRKRTYAREEQVTKVIDTLIDTLKGMLAPKSEGTLVEAKPGLAEQRAQQQAEDLKGALERMAKLYGPAQEPVTAVTEVPAQGAKARSGPAIPKGFTGAREGRQSSNAKPITEAPVADDSNARLGTKELDREIAAGRARLKLAKSKRPNEETWPAGFGEKMRKRKAAALERAATQKEKASEKEQGQEQGRREEGRREEVLKQNAQSVGTGPSVPTTTTKLNAQGARDMIVSAFQKAMSAYRAAQTFSGDRRAARDGARAVYQALVKAQAELAALPLTAADDGAIPQLKLLLGRSSATERENALRILEEQYPAVYARLAEALPTTEPLTDYWASKEEPRLKELTPDVLRYSHVRPLLSGVLKELTQVSERAHSDARTEALVAEGYEADVAAQISELQGKINALTESMENRPETGPDAEAAVGAKNRAIAEASAKIRELRRSAAPRAPQAPKPQSPKKTARAAALKDLQEALERMRGPDVKLAVNNLLSGYGKYERTVHGTLVERLITIAHAAPNKMSVLYHEALHDFFAELGKDPATLRIKQQLLAAASTGHVQKQLRELLKNEPAALAQLSDPEERLAYMFQFRMANPDMMRIGPNTDTLFQRIAAAIRKFTGLLTTAEKAEQILLALYDGRLADPSTAAQVMAQWNTAGDTFQRYAGPIKAAIERVFSASTVQLRAMNIPALSKIADLFEDNVKKTGLLIASAQSGGIWRNKLERILKGHDEKEIKAAMVHMQSMKDPVTDLHKKLAEFFEEIRDWQIKKGVKQFTGKFNPQTGEPMYEPMGKVKRYFPRVVDLDMITKNGPQFSRLLQKHMGYSQKQADDVLHQLRVGDQMLVKPHGVDREAGFSPYAQSVISRELILDEAGATALAEAGFWSQDFAGVMTRYIDQAVHRAEYAERFGNIGEKLDAMMERAEAEGATKAQLERAKRLISGLDGTLHRDMNPTIKQIQMALLTLQNAVLLPLAVFSQLIDPLGIAVRSGDLADAGAAYKRVLTDISQWVSGKKDRHREMAQIIGAVQQDSVMQAMGMVHNGMYMSRGLQKVNNFIFKYNGMQGINNSFRTAAVTAAEKYILEHRNDARRMEELDLTPADIKEVKPGEIDYTSEKIQQALFRFADGAVVRPNAAHRPLWMSDPRLMLVGHLKQFAFSFQEVILKRVAHEKSYGNSGPLKVLAMYAPIMFAADMAKWMLFGGMPQGWSYLEMFAHAVHRSGLLGVGTFGADAVVDYREDRSALFGFLGPTAEHAALLASWIGGGAPLDEVIDRTVPLARLLTK